MSDTYYQQRAARRTRAFLIVAAIAAVAICVVAGVAGLFYDSCTRGFDRSPRSPFWRSSRPCHRATSQGRRIAGNATLVTTWKRGVARSACRRYWRPSSRSQI